MLQAAFHLNNIIKPQYISCCNIYVATVLKIRRIMLEYFLEISISSSINIALDSVPFKNVF